MIKIHETIQILQINFLTFHSDLGPCETGLDQVGVVPKTLVCEIAYQLLPAVCTIEGQLQQE